MKYFSTSFILLLIVSTLKSQTIDSLEYNQGGGVTGIISSFRYDKKSIAFAEGRVNLNYTYSKKMKKPDWKQIMQLARKLLNDNATYYTPANYYQSIIIYSKGKTIKYMWPKNDSTPSSDLKILSTLLQKNQ